MTYVKAVSLSYFLDVSEDWKNLVGDDWEKQFLEDVEKFADLYYPDLEVNTIIVIYKIACYIKLQRDNTPKRSVFSCGN